ncbi:MAG: aldehyde ferredoxin oxidoreductase family protein [Candidatus Bipolaricaulota bacterium]|nr:aldehyde ferredoxin oxidoreductase family protein [Candidatus Bipolaricaulota bacterium]
MDARYGRYLDVDLSSGAIRDYAVPEAWSRLHLGGKGVAARILLEELPIRVDPLGPENVIAFATGPLQGTGVVGAGRHAVLAVSPKTGWVADSYAGGHFGHELGRSGYDGVLVRGRSPHPVYLTLIDGVAALHAADDLWGSGTGETEIALQERHPHSRVSSIGIAGESLVSQACIINDRTRSAGRPGLGAVMGSKLLKAIVVRGSVEKPLHDAARFRAERAEYVKTFLTEGSQEFGKYGTASGVPWLSEQGILPTRNFAEGVFEGADAISGERMHDTILVGQDTCAGCPVRCKRVVKTTFDGCDVLPEFGGPEYETVGAFGSMCLNADLPSIALANQLCNDYGLDTISTGVAVAFLMEASEKGLIDEEIAWGDAHAVISVVHALARREGIGDRLADGLDLLARDLSADFAMAVKGAELPMHEPRGKQGLGLSYATSPRGATHLEGMHDTMLERETPCPELGVTRSYDRFTLLDKIAPAVAFEDLRSFTNSLVLCCFTTNEVGSSYNFPAIRSLLEAATGLVVSAEEMLRIGARNYALLRLLSGRAGHVMEADELPRRFAEPLPGGASAGHPITAETMAEAVAAYYRARGYDRHGPTDATLRRLGLADCAGRMPRTAS